MKVSMKSHRMKRMGGPVGKHLTGGKFAMGGKHLGGGKFDMQSKHLGGTNLSKIKRMSASGAEVRQKMQEAVSRIKRNVNRSIVNPGASTTANKEPGARSNLAHASQYTASRQEQLEGIITRKPTMVVDYSQGNSSGLSSSGLTDISKRITTTIGSIGLVNTVMRQVDPPTGEKTVI